MNFLKQFTSVSVSIMLAFIVASPATLSAQTAPALSPAVVNTATQAIVSTYNHRMEGTLQPGDLQSTATALQILFAYLQEYGVNARLDAALRGNPKLLQTANTSELSEKLYPRLQASGTSFITLGRISNSLNMSPADQELAIKEIQTKGVAEIESEMVQEFLILSQAAKGQNAAFRSVNGARARLRLATFSSAQCHHLLLLSAEATSLAIAATFLGVLPVAAAFEAVALAYEAEALAGGAD